MGGDLMEMTPEKKELVFMRRMLESLEKTVNRVDRFEERIETLTSVVENDVFITCRQASLLQNTVAQRVRTFLAEVGFD